MHDVFLSIAFQVRTLSAIPRQERLSASAAILSAAESIAQSALRRSFL
jgi:hypothetical protein